MGELLRTNLFLGTGIFGCEAYRVFSDVATWLSPGKVETVKIDDVEGNFHFAKRKETGTWINSNMFIQTWKKIQEEDMWSSKDWTAKVDADAVFLPMRLREKLGGIEVSDKGIYRELQVCQIWFLREPRGHQQNGFCHILGKPR